MVEGQVHGGVTQGIGQALMEMTRYDKDGQLLTGSYHGLRHAARLATCRTSRFGSHPVPAKSNLLGVKGCGEAGCSGSLPAVMNAVVDALSVYGIHAYRHAGDAAPRLAGDPERAKVGMTAVANSVLREVLRAWAASKPTISALYIFGSYAAGKARAAIRFGYRILVYEMLRQSDAELISNAQAWKQLELAKLTGIVVKDLYLSTAAIVQSWSAVSDFPR